MVARGSGLDDRGGAVGREEAGQEDARLHLGARHRQLPADSPELAARDSKRRVAVGRLDGRAHLTQRIGDPVERAPRSDSSPTSSKLPPWPARRPGRRRMRVPAFRQSIGPVGSRRRRRPTPRCEHGRRRAPPRLRAPGPRRPSRACPPRLRTRRTRSPRPRPRRGAQPGGRWTCRPARRCRRRARRRARSSFGTAGETITE